MGVPKFFRWISERYPALSTSVKPDDVPEFDCLYLDMNGIIHPCSHPSDDPTFRISEEQIFDNVFRYIEFLIQTIKPQKTFFMAVDGCAPRAKMNQQRARRFSTAKNAEEEELKARKRGIVIPDKKDKFDSNTITPGTDFMDRLDNALRYYVQRRISENDEVWTKPEIIYSGHQTPGEGEHKIADYVRYLRTSPEYDGNLRHCLYGLDADLIHLALASHEKNFCLLREEVKFGAKTRDRPGSEKKNSPIVKPEKVQFFLLSVNVLRSYLELHEYKELSGNLNENWDKIRLVDDWIFLNFLVGNDFIPHAPHLHIKQQHVPELIGYHIKTLRYFRQKDRSVSDEVRYLIKDGMIDMPAFIHFITLFADDFDTENHQKHEADAAWLGGKRGARKRQDAFGQAKAQGKSRAEAVKAMYVGNLHTGVDVNEKKSAPTNSQNNSQNQSQSKSGTKTEKWEKPRKTAKPSAFDFGDSDSENEEMDISGLPEEMQDRLAEQGQSNKVTKIEELDAIEDDAFTTWRQRYYWAKWKGFGVESWDPNAESDFVHSDFKWKGVDQVCADYVKTLQWITHYYFNGIQSWAWFYPHHYSPFLTDVARMLKKCIKNPNFKDQSIENIVTFPDDKPFLPFQQLMGVLPPASRKCLPIPYHIFMTDEKSPIIDFYPIDFIHDLNGKDQDWEAVVCIPFIDEKRLTATIATCDDKLTDYERQRNRHVPPTVFSRSEERVEIVINAPNSKFRACEINFANAVDLANMNVHRIPIELVNRDTIGFEGRAFTPGFPYLDYIPHISEYTNASVMVFEQASNNKSCVLFVQNEENTAEDLANKLLNPDAKFKTWVNWPHMFKAQVCEVFDAHRTFYPGQHPMKGFKDTGAEHPNYHMLIDQIVQDRLYKKRGIDAKDYTVIARVKPRIGQKLMFISGKGFEVRDIFSDEYEYHLAELIQVEGLNGFKVRNSTMEETYLVNGENDQTVPKISEIPGFKGISDISGEISEDMTAEMMLAEIQKSASKATSMSKSNNLSYKIGTQIFITNDKHQHFGSHGKVIGIDSKGKIQAELFKPWYPSIKETAQKASEDYRRSKLYSTQDLCHQFQCSFNMVNIFVSMTLFHHGEKAKTLMSLNCKNEKHKTYNRRYCVPNFVNGEKSVKFTQRFLDDVNEFYNNWPQIFDYCKARGKVSRANADVKAAEMKKFDQSWTDETTKTFVEWLKNEAPWTRHEDDLKMSMTTRTLVKGDMEALEAEIAVQKGRVSTVDKKIEASISFNDTFQWCPGMNKFQPNRKDLFRLYDRVLLVRSAIGRGIPAGRYGTVVAEHYTAFSHILDVDNDVDNPTEVEILFDEGGENVSNYKDNILRIHISYLLKIESTIVKRASSANKSGSYQNVMNNPQQHNNRYQNNRDGQRNDSQRDGQRDGQRNGQRNGQKHQHGHDNREHTDNRGNYSSPRDAFSPRSGESRNNRKDGYQQKDQQKDQQQAKFQDGGKKQPVKLMQKSTAKKTNEHLENELKKMLNLGQGPVQVQGSNSSQRHPQDQGNQQNRQARQQNHHQQQHQQNHQQNNHQNPQHQQNHQQNRQQNQPNRQSQPSRPSQPNAQIQLNTRMNPAAPPPPQQSPSVLAQLFPQHQQTQNPGFDLNSFSQQMVRPPANPNQISNNAVNQLFNQTQGQNQHQNQNQQMFSPRQGQNFPQQAPQAPFQQNQFVDTNNQPMSAVRQPAGPPTLPNNHPSNQSFGFAKGQEQPPRNSQGFRGQGQRGSAQNVAQNQGRNSGHKPYQQLISNMQQPQQEQESTEQQQQQPQFSNPAVDNLFNTQSSGQNGQKGGKKFAPNFSATTPRSGRKGGKK